MTFLPGNTLGQGRKLGSRNKRNEELFARLDARGDLDPADLLSSIITNQQEPKELRLQAAGLLMPYKYSKAQAAPPRVYIEEQVKLPHPDPRTIQHSRENIAHLSDLKAQGRIDLVAGDNLIADQYKILSALVDEAKIAIQGGEQGDQVIRIEGGLPTMPGLESLIMPQINGHHSLELQAIESKPHNTTEQESKP
jgi:hypothetical protein